MEHAEMLGDVLLGGAERGAQLADGGVTGAQLVEEFDAHRLTQHAEALGERLWQGMRDAGEWQGQDATTLPLYSCEVVRIRPVEDHGCGRPRALRR